MGTLNLLICQSDRLGATFAPPEAIFLVGHCEHETEAGWRNQVGVQQARDSVCPLLIITMSISIALVRLSMLAVIMVAGMITKVVIIIRISGLPPLPLTT